MSKKVITHLLSILFISGCGSAWVIRRDSNGGTIGYKNYSSNEAARSAVLRLIHCPEYTAISDELRSSTATAVLPMQTTNYSRGTVYNSFGSVQYSGTETQTQYVPVTVDNSWREFTYECLPSTKTHSPSQKKVPRILFQTAEYPNLSEGEGTINFSIAIHATTDGKKAQQQLSYEFERRKSSLDSLKRQIGTSDQYTHVEYEAATARYKAELQQLELQLTEPIIQKMMLLLQEVGQQKGLGRVWEDNEDQQGIINLTETISTLYEQRLSSK